MKARKRGLILLLLTLCLLPFGQAEAASKKAPKSVKLNKKSASALPGKTVKLKAKVSPKGAKSAVTWSSSNPKVAVVDGKGKVTIQGYGTAKITARTSNGKKAVCTVKGAKYTRSNGKLSIVTPEGVKKYKMYSQLKYGNYYRSYGCVTTAVAIVASSYGKSYTPKSIHTGSAKAVYSERYALKKMKKDKDLKKWYGKAAISLRTASQILTDIGIPNQPVYKYNKSKAEKEIREHLKQGKPVIIKANTNRYHGIRLANSHHAIVLVGLDSKDQIIYVNPGRVQTYKIKLSTLLKHHMTPAKGDYMTPYVTKINTAGGYILIG